jgi:tetratricopeptide (TPR) repeat protein
MDPLYDAILDEVEDLHGTPHADAARLFEARAEAMEPGTPGRAAWLAHAGESWELAEQPARAKDCYEAAVADGGDAGYADARAELVGVLLDLGETARADEVLAEIRAAPDLHGEEANVHSSVGESLELNGRFEEALGWYDRGLDRAGDTDYGCLNGHYRVRRELGRPLDELDLVCEERRRTNAHNLEEERRHLAPPASHAVPIAVVYWAPGELEALLERWPELAEDYGRDHDEHRALVERRLRHLAEQHSWLTVGHGRIDGLLAWAAEHHEDPTHHGSRGMYAAQLALDGSTTPWPPRRNDRCWCGSGLKYKRCCGSPGGPARVP